MGAGDPSLRLVGDRWVWGHSTPAGPVTLQVEQKGPSLLVELWGEGSEWLEPRVEALLGLEDDPSSFSPRDPSFRRVWKRTLGIHLARLPILFPQLTRIVLQQLVTIGESQRAWRRIVRDLGSPAPGPHDLMVPPSCGKVADTPWFRFVSDGVPHKQARTLVRTARAAATLEAAGSYTGERTVKALTAIPGIGPWSEGYLRGTGLGDPDAVVTGDYHLPNAAAWILAGRPRGTDEEMLVLLEPYRGHRFRVIRALLASGIRAPRRGPKRGVRPLPGSPDTARHGQRSSPASRWPD